MAVVDADDQFVRKPEHRVLVCQAELIAKQILVVEHEEAIAVDGLGGRFEDVVLGVDPLSLGMEIIGGVR